MVGTIGRCAKSLGADFFEVVGGSREIAKAILGEAKNLNMDIAGHLVPTVSATESSDLGSRAGEHLSSGIGFLMNCAGAEEALRSAIVSGQGPTVPLIPAVVISPTTFNRAGNAKFYQRVLDTYSDTKWHTFARTVVKNDTWQVPAHTTPKPLQSPNLSLPPLLAGQLNYKFARASLTAIP